MRRPLEYFGEEFVMRDVFPCLEPALVVLKNKGYDVWVHPPTFDEGSVPKDPAEATTMAFWIAEKDGKGFAAKDAVTLLGMVNIWETLGPNWRRDTNSNLVGELLAEAFPDL